jgi:hypothetical protein
LARALRAEPAESAPSAAREEGGPLPVRVEACHVDDLDRDRREPNERNERPREPADEGDAAREEEREEPSESDRDLLERAGVKEAEWAEEQSEQRPRQAPFSRVDAIGNRGRAIGRRARARDVWASTSRSSRESRVRAAPGSRPRTR